MPKIRYSNHPIIVVPFNPKDDLTNLYSFDKEGDSFHSDPKYLERLFIENIDTDYDRKKYTSQESHRDSYNGYNYQSQRQRPISSVWPFFMKGNDFGFSLLKRQDGLSALNEKPSAYSLAAVGFSVYLAYTLFSGGFGRSTRRILKEAKQKSTTAIRGGAVETKTVAPSIAISQLYDTYADRTPSLPPIKVKLTKEKQQELKKIIKSTFSREHETADDFFTKIPLQEHDIPVPKEILSFDQSSSELEAKLPILPDKLNSSEITIPFLLQSNSDSKFPSNIYSKIFDKVPNSTEPNSNQRIHWIKDFNSIRKRIKASESLELFLNNSRTMVQQVDNPADFQSLPISSWTEDTS